MKLFKSSTQLLAALSLCVFASVTNAAIITWDPVQNSSGSADVVTSGSLVEAINATNSNSGSVLLNGVSFSNSNDLLSQGGFVGALDGNTTGDASYDSFLNTFDFGNGTGLFSLLLGNGTLQNASTYLIQIWFTDLRSCCSGRNMLFGDGNGNDVLLNASNGGFGQFVTGTFTADATNLELFFDAQGFGNAHIGGYQIRQIADNNNGANAVPAPGALLMLGLALCGLALTRRKTY